MAFDPFGDGEIRGYLRNHLATNDLAFIACLKPTPLRRTSCPRSTPSQPPPRSATSRVLDTHRRLFSSVYPWAGEDRATLAPDIAIGKGGLSNLFAHPADVRRAAEYGLAIGLDATKVRASPGEVFGTLAYAHPFLEGNGRTIMTVLTALTDELRAPGSALDALILPHVKPGPLPTERTATSLAANRDLNRAGASPSP